MCCYNDNYTVENIQRIEKYTKNRKLYVALNEGYHTRRWSRVLWEFFRHMLGRGQVKEERDLQCDTYL